MTSRYDEPMDNACVTALAGERKREGSACVGKYGGGRGKRLHCTGIGTKAQPGERSPDTEKTPPIMAHTDVRNSPRDGRVSSYVTLPHAGAIQSVEARRSRWRGGGGEGTEGETPLLPPRISQGTPVGAERRVERRPLHSSMPIRSDGVAPVVTSPSFF